MEKYFHYLKSLDKNARKELISACITYIVKQHGGEYTTIQNIYEEESPDKAGKYIRVSVHWEGSEEPKLIFLLNDFDIRYRPKAIYHQFDAPGYDIYYDGNLYRFYHELMADIFGMPYAEDFRLFCWLEKHHLEWHNHPKDSYTDLVLRNRRLYSEASINELINGDSVFMIDIDGVILDTEARMRKKAQELGWKEALATTNWHEHIYTSTPIADSINILRDVTYPLKGRVFLLSTSHSYDEEKEKINYFRDQDIILPIISVPPKTPKSTVVVPKLYLTSTSTRANIFLVDDQEKNVDDWWDNGGHALLFTDKDTDKPYQKVKSLDFLRQIH